MAVTYDYQLQFNGLLLGDGTPYDLVQIDGLLDLPGVRTGDRDRLFADGKVPGQDSLDERVVTLTIEVWPDNPGDLAGLIAALQAAFTVSATAEQVMTLQIPAVGAGGLRQITGRTRQRSAPLTLDTVQGHVQFVVQVNCSDPVIYDAAAGMLSCSLPAMPGGLTFNATAPLSFGTLPGGGALSVVNAGNYVSFPVIRVDGPIGPGGFTLSNDTTGQVWSTSTQLVAGDWLIIDMSGPVPSALLRGVASRFTDVDPASSWWGLAPAGPTSPAGPSGLNNISFRAAAQTSATATITWRSAWV